MTFPVLAASNPSGYQISRSVRFRSSSSAYFNRTLASGSATTWTWSGWVKRGTLAASSFQTIFGTSNGANEAGIRFVASGGDIDRIEFYSYSGAYTGQLITTQVFRDPSAWYHFVAVYDTTNATSADRIRLYVNGVRITSFTTTVYPSAGGLINTALVHNIGAHASSSRFFDGYMTEMNFIDGQALTPTSFGAFDAVTGVWNPKKYGGTYGTNGFYLNFSDNSAATATTIGKDSSGNGNNWTPNNISVTAGTTYDSMVDTPTNYGTDTGVGGEVRGNYAVLNATQPTGATYSNGNLFCSGTVQCGGVSSLAMSSGKWYAEVVYASGSNANIVGIMNASVSDIAIQDPSRASTGGVGYYALNGYKYIETTASAYGATYTTGDLISIAVDMDNNTVQFYKNGVGQGVISTTINNSPKVFTSGNRSPSAHSETWNFGQRQFVYTAPSGYKALCTTNLPTPTINNGANYMAATLYTGNGTSQSLVNTVNGISFQPDLVWTKCRSTVNNHGLLDSVRGISRWLGSNTTQAEDYTAGAYVTAFNSNGFSVGIGGVSNENGQTYVGWQWKGGGTAVTNTAGSITSSVSANTTAGFSVVTYTGTGTTGATVGHGLGAIPQMIIVKNRSASSQWPVGHVGLTSWAYNLYLSLTNGQAVVNTSFNSTTPTSTVFTLGPSGNETNLSGQNFVAYCFTGIAGYSAFGKYTGNGSTDGPFVYCGFRPRYVLIKRITGAQAWQIQDTSRNPYNPASLYLEANTASVETNGGIPDSLDILSNGFKLRTSNNTWNGSGDTYIYAAFAENPFTISRAR